MAIEIVRWERAAASGIGRQCAAGSLSQRVEVDPERQTCGNLQKGSKKGQMGICWTVQVLYCIGPVDLLWTETVNYLQRNLGQNWLCLDRERDRERERERWIWSSIYLPFFLLLRWEVDYHLHLLSCAVSNRSQRSTQQIISNHILCSSNLKSRVYRKKFNGSHHDHDS